MCSGQWSTILGSQCTLYPRDSSRCFPTQLTNYWKHICEWVTSPMQPSWLEALLATNNKTLLTHLWRQSQWRATCSGLSWSVWRPKAIEASLTGIWHLCKRPQIQHWHQNGICIGKVKSISFTMVTPWVPAPPNSHSTQRLFQLTELMSNIWLWILNDHLTIWDISNMFL